MVEKRSVSVMPVDVDCYWVLAVPVVSVDVDCYWVLAVYTRPNFLFVCEKLVRRRAFPRYLRLINERI